MSDVIICSRCGHALEYHNESGGCNYDQCQCNSNRFMVEIVSLRAENARLREALEGLIKFADIAVNQIICMGGREICQPCRNREEVAVSLEISRNVLNTK
jgi:hypothetical protein